jgi:hypothetical protein
MSAAVDRFITELRADPEFAASAQSIADCIADLDFKAALSPDVAGFYEAVHYVVADRGHSLHEKIEKLDWLAHLPGKVSGTLKQIVGW